MGQILLIDSIEEISDPGKITRLYPAMYKCKNGKILLGTVLCDDKQKYFFQDMSISDVAELLKPFKTREMYEKEWAECCKELSGESFLSLPTSTVDAGFAVKPCESSLASSKSCDRNFWITTNCVVEWGIKRDLPDL